MSNPPTWEKLRPGVSLTLDKSWGQRQLVCDDLLYLKPTPAALAALPGCPTAPPYPGAKLHLLVTDALDDPDRVMLALRAIANDLPMLKPKKPKI